MTQHDVFDEIAWLEVPARAARDRVRAAARSAQRRNAEPLRNVVDLGEGGFGRGTKSDRRLVGQAGSRDRNAFDQRSADHGERGRRDGIVTYLREGRRCWLGATHFCQVRAGDDFSDGRPYRPSTTPIPVMLESRQLLIRHRPLSRRRGVAATRVRNCAAQFADGPFGGRGCTERGQRVAMRSVRPRSRAPRAAARSRAFG